MSDFKIIVILCVMPLLFACGSTGNINSNESLESLGSIQTQDGSSEIAEFDIAFKGDRNPVCGCETFGNGWVLTKPGCSYNENVCGGTCTYKDKITGASSEGSCKVFDLVSATGKGLSID